MLTLITGTPGAGKSLMSVWDYARKVPGSTVETSQSCVSHGVTYDSGSAVPRHLFTNIKGLLIEHTHIDAERLMTWHEWAQPGDVILYDEVQEVWRPRALGKDVPACVAALETHRHLGVDIILVTQHPMLLDANVRRLTNQHIHLRRITKTCAYVYEWDGCSVNPGATKSAVNGRLWWHPKKAYALYKSAQLHTKPTAKMPRIAWLGLAAAAGLAYVAPTAYGRITERFQPPAAKTATAPASSASAAQKPTALAVAAPPAPVVPLDPPTPLAKLLASRPAGCIALPRRCVCFAADGMPIPDLEQAVCVAALGEVSPIMIAGGGGSAAALPARAASAAPGAEVVPLALPPAVEPVPAGIRVNGIGL